MADTQTDKKTTLFFVKNMTHQFGPVEKFLIKRGYNVIVENDVRTGLDRIMETNPAYIFLAWDHQNVNVRAMPKTIYQSCTGQIVPFIMSSQRDQILQLETSGFENKLYPPLSGPAIIRLIQKQEKRNQVFDQINSKKSSPTAKKESEMIQVKSFFTSEDEQKSNVTTRKSASVTESERKKSASRNRGQAQKFAKSNDQDNQLVSSSGKYDPNKAKIIAALAKEIDKDSAISEGQKQTTKINLSAAVEKEYSTTNGGPQDALKKAIEEEIDQIGELSKVDKAITKARLLALLGSKPGASQASSMSLQLPKAAKKLSQNQKQSLDKSFAEVVKPEMFDLIENYSDITEGTSLLTETTKIYVMAIQEIEWTGYLTVASENFLDAASAQVILNNWLKQMIQVERIDKNPDEQEELPESVLFEIHVPKVNFADFCSYKADFFKDIQFEDKKTMLGFFSFSPYQVINAVHETSDMLELSTEFLQPNQSLPFDVNFYLPENKRFILYLRPESFLDDAQVSRLQTRKVQYIYSNMDYEWALLKYKAEFNLRALIESYIQQIKGSNT